MQRIGVSLTAFSMVLNNPKAVAITRSRNVSPHPTPCLRGCKTLHCCLQPQETARGTERAKQDDGRKRSPLIKEKKDKNVVAFELMDVEILPNTVL